MTASRSKFFRLETMSKASPDEAKPAVYKFRANDGEFDRYQDRLSVGGWKLDAFNQNPVIFFNHDDSSLPIGRGKAYVEGNALMVEIEFDQKDAFAKQVEQKVADGYLNAVSVRYLMHDYTENSKGGFDCKAQELLEISVVTIPGNQRAVRVKGLEEFAAMVAEKMSPGLAPQHGAAMDPELKKMLDAQAAQIAELKAANEKAAAETQAKSLADAKAAELAKVKAEARAEVEKEIVEGAKGSRGPLIIMGTEKQAPKRAKGAAFGQYVLAWAGAGGAVHPRGHAEKGAMTERLKSFGSEDMAKTLQESVFTAGGSAVPVEYSSEFIEFLRAQLVLSQLGVQQTAFKSEKVIGRQDGGMTAYWLDEGTAITKSTPSTGQIKLKARKIGVAGNVSNDILRNPAAGFDDVNLTADMVAAARVEIENQCINSLSASSSKPRGILGILADAGNGQSYGKAGTSVANYIADIDKLVKVVDDTNRARQSRAFLMGTAVELALLGLRDNAGWVFRQEMMDRGTLRGLPFVRSTLMPSTHLIFGEWSDLVLGMDLDGELSSSNAPQFLEDETTFKFVARMDMVPKRLKSFACINNY